MKSIKGFGNRVTDNQFLVFEDYELERTLLDILHNLTSGKADEARHQLFELLDRSLRARQQRKEDEQKAFLANLNLEGRTIKQGHLDEKWLAMKENK